MKGKKGAILQNLIMILFNDKDGKDKERNVYNLLEFLKIV